MRSVLVLVAGVMAVANAASAETQLERGAYLVDVVGACDNCHTPRPNRITDFSKRLSGGTLVFNEVWFTARATNITPDPETGIGKWSDDALKAAIVKGVRPNGTPVAPVMPFSFYAVMSAGDQDAMVAYLRTIPAITNEVPPPTYKTEFYKLEYPDAARITEEEMKNPVRRGAYLAGLMHCMACHARRDEELPPDFKGAWGAGGRKITTPAGEVTAQNISSHPVKGLAAWSDAEIKRALTEAISKDGRKLKPPMSDFSFYWKKLRPDDLDALVAWIRSIPPIE